MKKLFLLCSVILLFAGCNKITDKPDDSKKNIPGTYNVSITGHLNQQLNFQGSCTHVFAEYMDFSNMGLPNTKSLTIQGFDDQFRLIGIVLYFTNLPADGVFHLGIDDQAVVCGGMGQYNPNVSNTSTMFYTTTDVNLGTCTISEYNKANQVISGTFSFSGQGGDMNGGSYPGVTANFSGSFTNIPINDLTDPNTPKGVCFGTVGNPIGTGGGGGGGGQTSTITFINPAFTPIDITFNGQTKTAPVGGNAIFPGPANTAGTGTASTSGKTTSGTQVGLLITWNSIAQSFPAAGTTLNYNLNIGGDFFFLKMKNTSSNTIQKVYVNYNLESQTLDNLSIPNDGVTYSLGYYKAFTNSNVRAESGNSYWNWNQLNFAFTNNQTITVQAN